MCHVSFTLILKYGLEGMQSDETGACQRITAGFAILILVNMMVGTNIKV
jgi:hypothetical protein